MPGNILNGWLGAPGTLVVALIGVFMLLGLVKAYAPRSAPVLDLTVAGKPAQLTHGEQLAQIRGAYYVLI